MGKSLKNILSVLLLAGYFMASNGMILEGAARWYSTGGEAAIAFHGGGTKPLPIPSLTQRTYTPLTFSIVVLPAAFFASRFVYPAEQPHASIWFEEALPSYTAELFSALSDRAPPTA